MRFVSFVFLSSWFLDAFIQHSDFLLTPLACLLFWWTHKKHRLFWRKFWNLPIERCLNDWQNWVDLSHCKSTAISYSFDKAWSNGNTWVCSKNKRRQRLKKSPGLTITRQIKAGQEWYCHIGRSKWPRGISNPFFWRRKYEEGKGANNMQWLAF